MTLNKKALEEAGKAIFTGNQVDYADIDDATNVARESVTAYLAALPKSEQAALATGDTSSEGGAAPVQPPASDPAPVGWREALKDCADDLEAFIQNALFHNGKIHPANQRRYDRDIAPVLRARTLLAIAAAPEPPISDGWRDVIAERRRQISAECWTPEHDDAHRNGELAQAAACYADGEFSDIWPWDESWWKPTTRRRNLVKAGALILAEIERLDRLPAPPKGRE